jgi:hypothetical protein
MLPSGVDGPFNSRIGALEAAKQPLEDHARVLFGGIGVVGLLHDSVFY